MFELNFEYFRVIHQNLRIFKNLRIHENFENFHFGKLISPPLQTFAHFERLEIV